MLTNELIKLFRTFSFTTTNLRIIIYQVTLKYPYLFNSCVFASKTKHNGLLVLDQPCTFNSAKCLQLRRHFCRNKKTFFFLRLFFLFFILHTMTALSNFTDYLERHPIATRLTLTAIAASALTATALLGYQSVTRPRLVTSKKTRAAVDLPTFISIIDEESKEPVREKMDDSLVLELLARNIAFFGDEGVTKIRNSFVVVLGAGAIGSWTALMLTRSGVEHIRIVDFGMVRLETMSRNAVAKIADIGKSKATIMKKYIAEVAPNAQVEPVTTKFTLETMEDMLAGNPDYVVDTLPNIKDKVLLAKYCKENNIKIISAMSAGAKADPTLMQMTDVSNSFTDPLARMYRRQLRKLGVDRGIPVVYSSEKSLHVGEKGNYKNEEEKKSK